ncbi:MAG: hypothetical protein ACKO37_06395 [Vampirovibrionales bacterium]
MMSHAFDHTSQSSFSDDAASNDILTLQLQTPVYDGGIEIHLKKYFQLQDHMLQEVMHMAPEEMPEDPSAYLREPHIQAQYVTHFGKKSRVFQVIDKESLLESLLEPSVSHRTLERHYKKQPSAQAASSLGMMDSPFVYAVADTLNAQAHDAQRVSEGVQLLETLEQEAQRHQNPMVRYFSEGPLTLFVCFFGFLIGGIALGSALATGNVQLKQRAFNLFLLSQTALSIGVRRTCFLPV